jgi:hypothetical protein
MLSGEWCDLVLLAHRQPHIAEDKRALRYEGVYGTHGEEKGDRHAWRSNALADW